MTLPTDADIAALCNGIYAYPGYAPVAWDHFEAPDADNGICWGLKRLGDVDVVVLRGSTTPEDWMRDFEAIADPYTHSSLGPVHPGFLAGLEAAWAAMRPLLGARAIVSGHSLGAGRAAILTGLMLRDGCAPLARIVFGEPRPGFAPLARCIAPVPARSYCNGDGARFDLVTEVPIAIGPENYVHPCPLTSVCAAPGPNGTRQWGIFAWHAMPLYLAALEQLEGRPPSGPTDVPLTQAALHAALH